MPEPKDVVQTSHFKGFSNTQCEFFPCHKGVKREFNCLNCFCPLYFVECPGPYEMFTDKYGDYRKDCTNCTLPHDGYEQSWNFIMKWMEVKPLPWDGSPQSRENILRLNQRRTLHSRRKREGDNHD